MSEENTDIEFYAWRDSLPAAHWSKYDLAACRLGWDAAKALRASGEEKNGEHVQKTANSEHVATDMHSFNAGVDHIADAGKMVLVPVEPTAEMRSAAYECAVRFNRGRSLEHIGSVALDSQSIYRAMIAAAPVLTNTDLSLRAENERLRGMVDGYGKLDAEYAIAERRATTAEAKLEEAAKVLEPFVEVNAETNVRKFLQFPIHPEGDDSPYDWAPKFKALQSFLANLKGAE